MQKKLFVLLISIIQLNLVAAQNKDFVGRILYKNTFFTPDGVNRTKEIAVALGAEQDYYISGANYKSICNGMRLTMQLYNGKTNKYYIVLPDKTATVFDGSTVSDSVLSVTHGKTDTLILGRKCKSVVINTVQSMTTYYYDPSVKVNKDDYKKHEFGNWNRFLQESNGALPIKYIVVNQMFTWDAEATKIESLTLSDKDFELGADIMVKE